MKGIVFTEFIEMVETKFSTEISDDIIESSDLPSGGVYTSVGTYSSDEMTLLVTALSACTGVPVPELLKTYGCHLFERFFALHPQFFSTTTDLLTFLSGIETVIHTEVHKLYPEAELPSFDISSTSPTEIQMVYRSARHLEDLAEGLLEGAAAHFGEAVDIERHTIGDESGAVRFTVSLT